MSFHRARLWFATALIAVVVVGVLLYGMDYYQMDVRDRVFDAKHEQLRPSGSIGLKLGTFGVFLFLCLYAYPVRKRWKWLQRFGKTRNWLDFHILFGLSVPAVITLHSSFKFQGLAGVAYWLMMAVAASGIAGRYLYAQIPKNLNETALTLDEIRKLCEEAKAELASARILPVALLDEVLQPPSSSEQISMTRALFSMMWRDCRRPFQAARLRRACSWSWGESLRTAFGILPSSNPELERAVLLVRTHSRLVTKMAFLERANEIFQLWHVVHRPFSYSFAVLACVHVTLVLLLGYY